MAAQVLRATYVKDSGETSERELIAEKSDTNLLALDVTGMSEADQQALLALYNEYQESVVKPAMAAVPSFAKFASERAGVVTVAWKSFKLAGLRVHG